MFLKALNDILPKLEADPSYQTVKGNEENYKFGTRVTLGEGGDIIGIECWKKGRTMTVTLFPGTPPSGPAITPQAGFSRNLWDAFAVADPKKGDADRPKKAFKMWVELHENYTREVEHPPKSLLAFSGFLKKWMENVQNGRHVEVIEGLTGSSLKDLHSGAVGFVFENKWIHDEPWVQDLCRRYEQPEDGEAEALICQILGFPDAAATLHPKIKVGGNQPIFSANKQAFVSFGNEDGRLAGVGRKAAKGYASALNALALHNGGKTHLARLGGAHYVFWTSPEPSLQDHSILSAIFGEDEQTQDEATLGEIRSVFEQGREGKKSEVKPIACHILGLRPATGRTAVIYYKEAAPAEILGHLEKHEMDIAPDWIGGRAKKLWQLVGAVDASAAEATCLLMAAISGAPYPDSACIRAVNRIKTNAKISLDKLQAKDRHHKSTAQCLTQLATGWIIRNKGTADLMNTHPFKLGQFLQLAEAVQTMGSGGRIPNKGVVERFGTLLCERPAGGLAGLMKLYRAHLGKLRTACGADKLAEVEKKTQELLGELGTLPRTYSLEQQAQFWLGFYSRQNPNTDNL